MDHIKGKGFLEDRLWNQVDLGLHHGSSHLVAVWPWASCLTSLRLTFFICKIRLLISTPSQLWCSLHEMTYLEHLEWCLAHCLSSVNSSYSFNIIVVTISDIWISNDILIFLNTFTIHFSWDLLIFSFTVDLYCILSSMTKTAYYFPISFPFSLDWHTAPS